MSAVVFIFYIFCVIVSLRSYFYLVAAWKFGGVWGLRVKSTTFDLDIGGINVFKSGDVTPILFSFRFRKQPCLVQNSFCRFCTQFRGYIKP